MACFRNHRVSNVYANLPKTFSDRGSEFAVAYVQHSNLKWLIVRRSPSSWLSCHRDERIHGDNFHISSRLDHGGLAAERSAAGHRAGDDRLYTESNRSCFTLAVPLCFHLQQLLLGAASRDLWNTSSAFSRVPAPSFIVALLKHNAKQL